MQYAQHLTTGTRLPFTAAYFGTIALTMYFAVGVSQKFLTDLHRPFLDYLCSIQTRTWPYASLNASHSPRLEFVLPSRGQLINPMAARRVFVANNINHTCPDHYINSVMFY
jgi:hypothetical protein